MVLRAPCDSLVLSDGLGSLSFRTREPCRRSVMLQQYCCAAQYTYAVAALKWTHWARSSFANNRMQERNVVKTIDAKTLKGMINDGEELALLDVREEGEFGVAHMLYAIPLPYSVLEMRLGPLVPRRTTRTVLVDAGDGVGARAAKRMAVLGYSDVAVLEGGMPAWGAAGYEVFMGVNVPCKAFGEVVEHAAHTPSICRKNYTPCRPATRRSSSWTGVRRRNSTA